MNAQITSPTQVIDAHRESALVYRFLCIPARRPTRTVAGSRRGLSGACSAADIKLARPARCSPSCWYGSAQLAARARLDQHGWGRAGGLHGRRISAGSLPVSWHSPHSIPFRSRRAARMKAWTRRPQRSILIRSPVALCSQCHGAHGVAPRALRSGARGDTCAWRPSSCADSVNLSVLFHAAVRSEARSAAGQLRVAATAFRPIAVCAM